MSEPTGRRSGNADCNDCLHSSADRPGTTMAEAGLRRREVLKTLTALGIGSVSFQRALAAKAAAASEVTPDMLAEAEWIAGLELTPDERERTASRLTRTLQQYGQLRQVPLEDHVVPAIVFDPQPWKPRENLPVARECSPLRPPKVNRPTSDEEMAFLPVTHLSELIRTKQVRSTELTELYLERLKRFDPLLHCVVTLTEDLAMRQAKEADREIAAGRYRGPLHGIPWGAKDLIAYPGYPTTWGAPQNRERIEKQKATVAKLLDEAGSVMVAKLSLGALAQGDLWFGGRTRNPWNPKQGSSGSSAGSASAVAGGLVGFAIGSETLGSIVSPCRRCGCAGLRPTFGRVSRAGCMSLSWSMDKLGPIARSIEDCALIFSQIHGADGLDPAAQSHPFQWPPRRPLDSLKVGYFPDRQSPEYHAVVERVRSLGVQLIEVRLPEEIPVGALTNILDVEAAAAFDEWTRAGITEGLNSWPETFREGQFITAVEYLRSNRIRTKLMESMRPVFEQVDLYIDGDDLALTNLTGHPTAVVPHEMTETGGVAQPRTINFTGSLFGEEELLLLATAYQAQTNMPHARPQLEKWLSELAPEKR